MSSFLFKNRHDEENAIPVSKKSTVLPWKSHARLWHQIFLGIYYPCEKISFITYAISFGI